MTAEGAHVTVRVTLAEAPTDVLVYLAANPDYDLTARALADVVAPAGAQDAVATVAGALRTLWDAGYVRRASHTTWQVTRQGWMAVREASSCCPQVARTGVCYCSEEEER